MTATPLVRALAAAGGVDLASVTGSGVGGRITVADVQAAGNTETLHRYWVAGPGLAKWADQPHPWTALYHHLAKYMNPERAKRTAAQWFHEVKGYWPGDQKGNNPVGPG